MLTDDTGAVVWDANYRPFGEASVTGSVTFNLRFPGQYFDDETGLQYNMMRDYDASLGRYMQSDPIGLSGGWNTYAYASGNPLMRVDFLGRNATDVRNMLKWARTHEGPLNGGYDLRIPGEGEWEFGYLGVNVGGEYSIFDDVTTYNNYHYCDKLDCVKLLDLYETVVHEAIHRTICKKRGYWNCIWFGASDDPDIMDDGAGHQFGDWIYLEAKKRMNKQARAIQQAHAPDCWDAGQSCEQEQQ